MIMFILSIVVSLLVKNVVAFDIVKFFGNNTCCLRYQFLDDAKTLINCTELREINEVCRQNITVYYTELPPYVYTDRSYETDFLNGTTEWEHVGHSHNVTGILPGILRRILSEGCCLGCNHINYVFTTLTAFEVMYANITEYELMMPIENSRGATEYGHNKFITLLELDSVSFFGKIVKPSPLNLMQKLIESTRKTWPLYVISLSLAICAGSIIWILDTWFNKKEFPRAIPKGLFEGFWWAYVSMTTVGYGDRTPRSVIAKLFAVLWIMVGITIFNMYTAAITSVLTAELARQTKVSLYMQKVGILKSNIASYSGVVAAFASPKGYDNITSLLEALNNDSVKAIALENYMAQHYHSEIITPEINLIQPQPIDKNVLGIAASKQVYRLVKSFIERNEDYMDVIISYVLSDLPQNKHHHNEEKVSQPFTLHENEIQLPFSAKAPLFVFVLVGTLVASITLVLIGIIMNRFCSTLARTFSNSKKSSRLLNKSEDDEENNIIRLRNKTTNSNRHK